MSLILSHQRTQQVADEHEVIDPHTEDEDVKNRRIDV